MILKSTDSFIEIKKTISREKRIVEEMDSFYRNYKNEGASEKDLMSHVNYLKAHMKKENERLKVMISRIELKKQLEKTDNLKKAKSIKPGEKDIEQTYFDKRRNEKKLRRFNISSNERGAIKRIESKKSHIVQKKSNTPETYANISSKLFLRISRKLVSKKVFNTLARDLPRTNIRFIPTVYISMILFSTGIALILAALIFTFLIFFKLTPSTPPFIVPNTSDITSSVISALWVLFVFPIGIFLSLYFYPTLEKRGIESGIDQELPFATINMSAIAGSQIEPTNIFGIIITTGEYPYLKKQFTKILNEINIYGHDLVTSLRSAASECPSKKLSDLYNGLATNITSGGNLAEFFEKRSQSLLLDYRLQRERQTKSNETFIDIYISIVIAAPMILMLLLMMVQISGLGLSVSPSAISLMMVLGVAGVNAIFLMFLRIKQPNQ